MPDRAAIVTGASSGIGLAIARMLGEEGYGVTMTARRPEKLDGADICCPHAFHHTNGIACLDAGVNVLIEKPFGITIRASQALIAAGERNGKIAATAENVRRGLSQRTAHWLLNGRQMIGKPRLFFSQHASWSDPARERNWHWRIEKGLGGGGMVMDSGAH